MLEEIKVQFTVHSSQFTVHSSQFTAHNLQLTAQKLTSEFKELFLRQCIFKLFLISIMLFLPIIRSYSQNCPNSPIVVGNTSLCSHLFDYEIINFNPSFSNSYTFSFQPANVGNVVSFNMNTGIFEVNWNTQNACSLIVSLLSPCVGSDTIFMQPCCDNAPISSISDVFIKNLPGIVLDASGNGFLTGQTLTIQGTLKVNRNLTLQNCVLNMGPGARIDVYASVGSNPGNIVLINTTIQSSNLCNVMWEGIRMFENTEFKSEPFNATVNTIRDAQNAIAFYGNSGYHFRAAQTRLWNNYRSILSIPKVGNSINLAILASSGNLDITGNTLLANYVNGQNPLPVNNTGFTGIDLFNTSGFVMDAILGRNNISNLSFGIRTFDSNLPVNGTDFIGINFNNAYPFIKGGTAIYGERLTLANNISVSILPLQSVSTFSGCTRGINLVGSHNLSCSNNTFSNIVNEAVLIERSVNSPVISIYGTNIFTNCNAGIKIRRCNNASININANFFSNIITDGVFVDRTVNNSTIVVDGLNSFTNCNVGVKVRDCDLANVTINQNNFTSTAILGINSLDNIAINISNQSKPGIDYQIFQNNITGYRIGIYNINCMRKSRGFNPIRYNQIIFNRQIPIPFTNNVFTGVWLENVEDINLGNNTITYSQAAIPSNKSNDLRGFNIKDTKLSIVSSNILNDLGVSMRFVADNRTVSLQCNVMDGCNEGIFLNSTALSDQGSPTIPWDNQWKNFGSNRRVYGTIIATISQIRWYYKSSNNDFSPIIPNFPTWLQFQIANYPSPCDDATDPGDIDPEIVLDYLRTIVSDSTSIPSDSLDFLFRMRLFAYANLEENDSLREAVPEFMNFYAVNLNTTISRLVHAENAIEELDYSTATLHLNAAVCVETASIILQKTLNAIREYDLKGDGEVSDISFEEREELESIANLPSSVFGVGVFYARAILELEIDDVDLGFRIRSDDLPVEQFKTPRCFDALGKVLVCPDLLDKKIIKKKTSAGDFIIIN
jgi:hypothetical protein